MHPDLEKLVGRGKIDHVVGEKLDLLPPDTFCLHKSWGAGKVVEWDRLNLKVIVDFEDKPGHALGMKFAAKTLKAVTDDSFIARRHSKLEETQEQAKKEQVVFMKAILQENGDSLMLDELEALVKGRVVPEAKYKSWWDSTKKKLREDRQFVVPSKRTEPLELREEGANPCDTLIEDYNGCRDLKRKVKAVENIIKDVNLYEDEPDKLVGLAETVGEEGRKGVRINFVTAFELILSRDELVSKAKGVELGESWVKAHEILAEQDDEKLADLLQSVSLQKTRQILKKFPAAFGEDDWTEKTLSLIPYTNLRTISEIANFIIDSGLELKVEEKIDAGGELPQAVELANFLRQEGHLSEEDCAAVEEEVFTEAMKKALTKYQKGQGIKPANGILDEVTANKIKGRSYDAVIDYFENGLNQRTLTSDALAWICRERNKHASVLFDPSLSLSVMSSLETDQLKEEGAVRAANRLRDLINDDRDLIPDLIKDADINTIRNFASRLVSSASFDELTRKSLMARVIKLHPSVADLVAGKEVKEEVMFVSEESLKTKEAAYKKLISEEIPQNREDIKIARSYGDLRENFEYKSSKEYQNVLMKRKADWERDIRLANPMDFSSPDTSMVSIGTTVELSSTDGGDDLTYTILGAWDSDPDQGIIAYLSERGSMLLEKKVGEEVHLPTGEKGKTDDYKIASIEAFTGKIPG